MRIPIIWIIHFVIRRCLGMATAMALITACLPLIIFMADYEADRSRITNYLTRRLVLKIEYLWPTLIRG